VVRRWKRNRKNTGIKNTRLRVCTIVLFVCPLCLPQSEVRSVTGVVTDKRGNSLPGAVVEIEDTATLAVISYITAKDGRYHFARLSIEVDYLLKAKYRNYWSKPKTLSKFSSKEHSTIDLVIPID
jgi:hypothetical protein